LEPILACPVRNVTLPDAIQLAALIVRTTYSSGTLKVAVINVYLDFAF